MKAGTGNSEELFIAPALNVYSAGNGTCWISDHRYGRIHHSEDSLAALLPHLGAWRTLDGHIRAIEELGMGAAGSSMIGAAVRELEASGTLLSCSEFSRALAEQRAQPQRESIATITWCTRNRIEELARSVSSYRDSMSDSGKNATFMVFDDSTDAEIRRLNRGRLHQISPQIQYVGLEQKQRLAKQIIERGDGIDPKTVSFALFGLSGTYETTGANHNAMLLSTSGRMAISCDDDTISEFARMEDSKPVPVLSSAMDPTDYRFFESQDEIVAKVKFQRRDVLTLHGAALGASVGAVLAEQGGAGTWRSDTQLESCSATFARDLMRSGGTVAATATGVCGDCGLSDSRYLLAVQGHSRDLLMDSQSRYRAAALNRLLLRAVPHITVSNGTYFQATCVGLDNRLPLPPFFPVSRNSDGIFGQTLRSCFPHWYIAHLPWAVRHEPARGRHFVPEDLLNLSIRVPEIINLLLVTCERMMSQAAPMDRLDAMGRFFQDVAALPDGDFMEFLRTHYLIHASAYLEYFEAQLVVYGREPSFWANDVEAHLEAVRALPSDHQFCIPKDLREGRTDVEAIALTRQLVDQFGVLMESWPEILDAARSVSDL